MASTSKTKNTNENAAKKDKKKDKKKEDKKKEDKKDKKKTDTKKKDNKKDKKKDKLSKKAKSSIQPKNIFIGGGKVEPSEETSDDSSARKPLTKKEEKKEKRRLRKLDRKRRHAEERERVHAICFRVFCCRKKKVKKTKAIAETDSDIDPSDSEISSDESEPTSLLMKKLSKVSNKVKNAKKKSANAVGNKISFLSKEVIGVKLKQSDTEVADADVAELPDSKEPEDTKEHKDSQVNKTDVLEENKPKDTKVNAPVENIQPSVTSCPIDQQKPATSNFSCKCVATLDDVPQPADRCTNIATLVMDYLSDDIAPNGPNKQTLKDPVIRRLVRQADRLIYQLTDRIAYDLADAINRRTKAKQRRSGEETADQAAPNKDSCNCNRFSKESTKNQLIPFNLEA